MNTGFLFAATQFDDWRVEIPLSTAEPQRTQPYAEFEDWYRLIRELEVGLNHEAIVKPLSALWLGSFRFIEAGVLDENHLAWIANLDAMLDILKSEVAQSVRSLSERLQRVVSHLMHFAETSKDLYGQTAASRALPATGSVWDISWENLVISPSSEHLLMYYKDSEMPPFRLRVTEDGFICEAGYSGHWRWQQLHGGRVKLQIGDDYPLGWGWYNTREQHEIAIHFYKPAYFRAYERMRWVRCA